MKLALVFLALVGITFAAPHQQVQPLGNLRPALDQLLENVDVEGLLALVPQLKESEEGKAVLAYLRGPDFAIIVEVLHAEAEFEKIIDHLEANGLNVREAIRLLREYLEIPPRGSKAAPRDIQDIIDLIAACINTNGLLEDLLELVSVDEDVQELLAKLSQPEVRDAYQRIKNHEKVKELAARLLAVGIDITTIVDLIEAILGWSPAASGVAPKADNLAPALEQLLENVDLVGLIALLPQLEQSEEGQFVLAYLRGEKWGAILDALYAEKEFVNILNYLEANGLPEIREAIEILRLLLGIDRPTPFIRSKTAPQDLQEIIDQLLALLDVNGLLEDLLELLGSDVAVQNLLGYLSRPECRDAYQRIKKHPNVQDLAQALRDFGLDVDTILALLESILGWSRAASGVAPKADNLRPALEQLLENVDLVGLVALLPELEQSPEGQAVLIYLRSEKWGAILDALYAEKEFVNIINYLESNGLENIREAIRLLREALGIDRPTPFILKSQTQGARSDIIDQLLALINVNGLLEDLLELLGSDVAVQNLLGYLSRPECRDAYQRIKVHPEVHALAERLRELDIDVDTLLALLESILGWGSLH